MKEVIQMANTATTTPTPSFADQVAALTKAHRKAVWAVRDAYKAEHARITAEKAAGLKALEGDFETALKALSA